MKHADVVVLRVWHCGTDISIVDYVSDDAD